MVGPFFMSVPGSFLTWWKQDLNQCVAVRLPLLQHCLCLRLGRLYLLVVLILLRTFVSEVLV